MTPHPLEELARWHDNRASEYNRLGTVSGRSQADQHTAFGSILRSAIPNCECGELVREKAKYPYDWFQASCTKTSVDYPAHYTVAFRRHDTKIVGKYQGPTLAAAVSAARANGAEGTPNGSK